MDEDCEVYIDPEEDEVFFGSLSEKEQNLYSKLGKNAGLNPRSKDDCKLNEYACGDFNIENVNNKSVDGLIIKKSEGISKKEESEIGCKELENIFDQSQDLYTSCSNASVELEHNYSTPMKNKIDKTILSTPKSVVKADRDGGFLKVLSEIALVKAEADADKKIIENKKEDEDKENQIIPEIRVIEATPEKANITSPPKSINKQLRRFRIIYNSPNNEEIVGSSKMINTKSESFETSQNLKNKSLDYDSIRVTENILNNDKRKSVDCCNQSINLIDLNKSNVINEKEKVEDDAHKINKDVRINDSQSLKHVSEIDKLLLIESKDSEEVNQLVQTEKEERELVLVDKGSREEDYLVKDRVKAQEEEHEFISDDKEDFKKVDQLVQTQKEEHKSFFVGNEDSREEDHSVKEMVKAQEEEHEIILSGNKDSKELDQLVKKTLEAKEEECELILIDKKDSEEVDQSLKETVKAQEEEHELISIDNKFSKESVNNQSLKETIKAEKEEPEMILFNNNNSREVVQVIKKIVEDQKEECEWILINKKDSEELDHSLTETVKAQKEEHELILISKKDFGEVDQSLKETIKAEKEEHELTSIDKKDSGEIDQSLKETIKAQKEQPEMIYQKDDLVKEIIKAQKEDNKGNKIPVVSQIVGNQKEEPELIVLDEEENLVGEKIESFDPAKSCSGVQISEEKLEDAAEDREREETSAADPGEEIQNLEGRESGETLNDTVADPGERVEATSNPENNAQKSQEQLPKACRRFSKDARMIVDVLKKSIVDDTFNFTIQEIDAENVENSFLSPGTVTCFDESVMPSKFAQTPKPHPRSGKSSPRTSPAARECKSARKATTVEKERPHLTPASFRQTIKYFSQRKIYNQNGVEVKDCVKKLPFEAKKIVSEEKMKVSKTVEKGPTTISSSKIPVGGLKISKIPTTERPARPAAMRTTPLKTPTSKTYKNSKFNNIESPINAYINNKPTSLVLNVKPEVKKDSVSKMWKAQTTGSGKKIPERALRAPTPITGTRLPFVEYRSATPYKVEKRSESKLPRLAPTVQKLIGSHSPRVLKHEGRFYLKTPKKPTSVEDTTILADPNEVSVVVCQNAQKSNTFK